MRFYTKQHRHFCGIDLHARTKYICILNQEGKMVFHRNLPSTPTASSRDIPMPLIGGFALPEHLKYRNQVRATVLGTRRRQRDDEFFVKGVVCP